MTRDQLQKKISHLESVNDHLMTELGYLNDLLKKNGFPEGLESLKVVAQDMLAEGGSPSFPGENEN